MSLLGVSLAGSPLDESHPTAWRGTDEGFLSSVKSPVVVESVPLSEGPAAELTAVLLHPGVHVHVVLLTEQGQSVGRKIFEMLLTWKLALQLNPLPHCSQT